MASENEIENVPKATGKNGNKNKNMKQHSNKKRQTEWFSFMDFPAKWGWNLGYIGLFW